jgi:hypothetical protein
VAFGRALPTVAAAFGLLLGFDVVAVVADGSKVARVARVSAFADGQDLVDDVRGASASGRFVLGLMGVAF